MSKHQKGRRHRTVNRVPRPVGPARTPAASSPAVGPAVVDDERGSTPAPDGSLGHHAARTWQELQSAGGAGITVDELCTAVGYQSRTILKHLKVLAEDGLAEPYGERWRPTGQRLF